MFQGTDITYGFAPSPYGEVLIAHSGKGLCWLSFVLVSKKAARDEMVKRLNPNHIQQDDAQARTKAYDIFEHQKVPILDLRGTDFRMRVWNALLNIPYGKTVSYLDIAKIINNPKASRAVGQAVGANPISILVPCHRVIASNGEIGGYAWGVERKQKILAGEQAV